MDVVQKVKVFINEKYRTMDTHRLVMNAILVISIVALTIIIST